MPSCRHSAPLRENSATALDGGFAAVVRTSRMRNGSSPNEAAVLLNAFRLSEGMITERRPSPESRSAANEQSAAKSSVSVWPRVRIPQRRIVVRRIGDYQVGRRVGNEVRERYADGPEPAAPRREGDVEGGLVCGRTVDVDSRHAARRRALRDHKGYYAAARADIDGIPVAFPDSGGGSEQHRVRPDLECGAAVPDFELPEPKRTLHPSSSGSGRTVPRARGRA